MVRQAGSWCVDRIDGGSGYSRVYCGMRCNCAVPGGGAGEAGKVVSDEVVTRSELPRLLLEGRACLSSTSKDRVYYTGRRFGFLCQYCSYALMTKNVRDCSREFQRTQTSSVATALSVDYNRHVQIPAETDFSLCSWRYNHVTIRS